VTLAEPAVAAAISPAQELLVRAEKLNGATYKLRWPETDHAFYVTVNDIEHEGVRRPLEVFINSKALEHYAWVVALTRMISAVFRRGGDVSFVAAELKQVFDPRGGQWSDGRYVPSLVAAIGDILERHMIEIGFLVPASADTPVTAPRPAGGGMAGSFCPKCSHPGLIKAEGCLSCLQCGWSKCD
jgi:ribonucleoside-diphosphate reductase alpha chain